jgi:hypothetical protein
VSSDRAIKLPPRYSQVAVVDGNAARQLLSRATDGILERRDSGWSVVETGGTEHPLVSRGETAPDRTGLELPRAAFRSLPGPFDPDDLKWATRDSPGDPDDVRTGMIGQFVLRTEDPSEGTPGLRIPQAGALHAVLAHWSTGRWSPRQ